MCRNVYLRNVFQRFAVYFCILHIYEPESHLHRCLEHRDWPICGHKCSIESGSTARRRLDHPETITSSEKHTVVPRIDGRNAHCRMSFRIFSRIPIQFEKTYSYSRKIATVRIQRSTKILLDIKLWYRIQIIEILFEIKFILITQQYISYW